jgi:hypothetical protein
MQMQNLGIKTSMRIYRGLALPALGLGLLNLSPKRRERERRERRMRGKCKI